MIIFPFPFGALYLRPAVLAVSRGFRSLGRAAEKISLGEFDLDIGTVPEELESLSEGLKAFAQSVQMGLAALQSRALEPQLLEDTELEDP